MAKLSELKLLLDAARKKDRPNTQAAPERRQRTARTSPKAEADVDFEAAVGRVDRLPERNRAPVHRSSPSTLPLQRMRDDAKLLSDALAGMKRRGDDILESMTQKRELFYADGAGGEKKALPRGFKKVQSVSNASGLANGSANPDDETTVYHSRGSSK